MARPTNTPMRQDRGYASTFAEVLTQVLADADLEGLPEDEDEGTPQVNSAETFADLGIISLDGGVVAYLSDGTEVHLTVQAYRPRT